MKKNALLPEGFRDGLPPDAEHEAGVIDRLVGCFAANGYDRVKPPLIEFEESLLAGPNISGTPGGDNMFRLMDPVSHRMMGLRTDMTPQIARIAGTRLTAAARPLRISYAGQTLRVRGGQLRQERQIAQAGVELIGAEGLAADVEVILLAEEALSLLGVGNLSVDLALPRLVPALCDAFDLSDADRELARTALDSKDQKALEQLADLPRATFSAVISAAGEAARGLMALAAMDLPGEVEQMVKSLASVVGKISQSVPDLTLTIDPGEFRGFEYHTGIGFTFYARNVRGELGRGGRYVIAFNGDVPETAVGFSLYGDTLLRAVPPPQPVDRVFLPPSTTTAEGRQLRAQGLRTVSGLTDGGDEEFEIEARRTGCTHIYHDGTVRRLD